ncbi:hypothetical protein DYB35_012293 [Aphanomyces astaci]|uniref:Uncharacterized protein n=1 Tax=Aphanomyces astaci TaxID=112090 RepID=A0A3R6Y527_APHAT|nr:hypothetical protein DYB35_012293 [Aphanomyces astaci]
MSLSKPRNKFYNGDGTVFTTPWQEKGIVSSDISSDNFDFISHTPNIITELAIFPVAVQDVTKSATSLSTPRRTKPKHHILPPVVVDTPPHAALTQRTKVAAEVYLSGSSSDALVVVKPQHHLPQHQHPLEPLIFKGGKYKPYIQYNTSVVLSPKPSPRIQKLELQYGQALKRPADLVPHPTPSKASAASQVSGFCRQCLLVGDIRKLANCREHNYFPPLKPPPHPPQHTGPK